MLIKHESNPLLNWFLKKEKEREPSTEVLTRVVKQFKGKYKGEILHYDTSTGEFTFGSEFGVCGSDPRAVIEKLKASLAFMLAVEGR